MPQLQDELVSSESDDLLRLMFVLTKDTYRREQSPFLELKDLLVTIIPRRHEIVRLPSQIRCRQVLLPSLLQIPSIGEEVGAVDSRHGAGKRRILYPTLSK